MKSFFLSAFWVVCLIICFHADAQRDPKEALNQYQKYIPYEKLYLHTDRTLYSPGEEIWLKVYCTDWDHLPTKQSFAVFVSLYDSKDKELQKITLQIINGGAAGMFKLPEDIAGGMYELRAYTQQHQNIDKEYRFVKEITIQKYTPPRLLMQLDFEKEGYGASDQVVATFEARDLKNKPIKNHDIYYAIDIDGERHAKEKTKTNHNGEAALVFTLPDELQTNDGLITVLLEKDGQTESVTRAVPLAYCEVDLQLLPEGGTFVAGLESKIAFKALNEDGKPIDVAGDIVDENGNVVTSFESLHKGMGTFVIIPEKNKTYSAQIKSPKGATGIQSLPVAVDSGVVLGVEKHTTSDIIWNIQSPIDQEVSILTQMHGKVIHQEVLKLKKGSNEWRFEQKDLGIGIIQATVFDKTNVPLAERLVFVNKNRSVELTIESDKEEYLPKETINLTITAKDDTGKPLEGHFSLAVVNDQNYNIADDKQPHILAQLLLQDELKGEIFEPNFYFDTKNDAQKTQAALDLVMMTHGWRSFDWKTIQEKNGYLWRWDIVHRPFKPHVQGWIMNYDSICGAENVTVYLSSVYDETGQLQAPVYDAENAIATTKTNTKGKFSFGNIAVQFPLYAATTCDGKERYVIIENYSPNYLLNGDGILDEDPFNGGGYNVARGAVSFGASVQGYVFDKYTGKPISCPIEFVQKDSVVRRSYTHSNGWFGENLLPPGNYNLRLKKDDYHLEAKDLYLSIGDLVTVNLKIDEQAARDYQKYAENELPQIIVMAFRIPLIIQDNTTGGQTLGAEDIRQLSTRNISSIATTVSGVSGNDVYIDGVRVLGNASIPPPPSPIDLEPSIPVATGVSENQNGTIVQPPTTSTTEIIEEVPEDPLNYEEIIRGADKNIYIWEADLSFPEISRVKKFYTPKYKTKTSVRNDFRNTIFWKPDIETDAEGIAKVAFPASDDLTTFRAVLEGIGAEGQIGRTEHTFAVGLPFFVKAEFPINNILGDTVLVPIYLRNHTPEVLTGQLDLQWPEGIKVLEKVKTKIEIQPNSHVLMHIPCKMVTAGDNQIFKVSFESGPFSDFTEKEISIISRGIPQQISYSGYSSNAKIQFEFDGFIEGSPKLEFSIFPNVLSAVAGGYESILRMPSGCFEQVASSNYPNILAIRLMQETNTFDPAIYRNSMRLLRGGYTQLAAYETSMGGFEWYGGTPPHEVLTAYGLLQFHELENIEEGIVDQALVKRTIDWLYSRKDQKGGFLQNKGKYGFSASAYEVSNAYIVYALCRIGADDIDQELQKATQEAKKSRDSYRLGLMALAHYYRKDTKEALELLALLEQKVIPQNISTNTITFCSERAATLQVKSMYLVASLLLEQKNTLQPKLFEEIMESRKYSGFGSTQATIWCLEALTCYASKLKEDASTNDFKLYVNKKLVAKQDFFVNGESITIAAGSSYFKTGKNMVQFKLGDKSAPCFYQAVLHWHKEFDTNQRHKSLDLKTNWNKTLVNVGETARLNVELSSRKDGVASPMIILKIPGGMEPQIWQLKALKEKGAFDFYEIKGQDLVLYYRELGPKEVKTFALDLKAIIPGHYAGGNHSAYPYYDDIVRDWSVGGRLTINP